MVSGGHSFEMINKKKAILLLPFSPSGQERESHIFSCVKNPVFVLVFGF